MKPFVLLILSVLTIRLSLAQQVSIKDKTTKEALEFVVVSSGDTGYIILSDKNGIADISHFRERNSIEFRLLGYKTASKSFEELKSDGFVLWMSPLGLSLDEVVISASRWSQSTREIPGKVSSINIRNIELSLPQTAADLLGTTGKVFIQKSQQGGGSPMIRGFSTNRLLYTIDGIRMNTAIFRSGNLHNVISLDPLAIEKTEVLFGPASVIYGSDAIGGVMSFQTLSPSLSKDGKILSSGNTMCRFSSANKEFSAHFDINLANKKWGALTSFSNYNFGDLKMGNHGPEDYLRHFYVDRQDSMDVVMSNPDPLIQKPTAYSQINLMQKLVYRPADKLEFLYGFHFSETSDYSRYDRHLVSGNDLPRYGEWYYGPQKWMMNNFNITFKKDNALFDESNFRLALQSFGESRVDRRFRSAERHLREEKVLAWSINADFRKKAGDRHLLYYGIEYVYNDVDSRGTDLDVNTGISRTGPSRYPQSDWESFAIYLNYQLRLSQKILVQAGARYNRIKLDAVFDTAFYSFPFSGASLSYGSPTGSLGLVIRPDDKWVMSINTATAFRSPNVDDMGKVFDSSPGSVTVPNPSLKPEYAYNADLEIAKIFGEFLKADIGTYYTYLSDALVRRNYSLNGSDSILFDGVMSRVQAIQNAASAWVYGIQAGIEIKLPSGIGFNTDINYQQGEEELDDGTFSPSRHTPPVFGVSKLIYRNRKTEIQLYAVYSGTKSHADLAQEEKDKPELYAKDDHGNTYSPSWYTLNYKARYDLNDNFTLSAGLENITGQRYRSYSSGIAGAGRNFVMSVKVRF